MTMDRQALIRVCDDLLATGVANVHRDGFLIETLLGFRPDGSIVTFVAATDGVDADMTRSYISDEELVTVVDGRLVDSARLISLALRHQQVACVAHLAGGTVESTGETFVLSTVVWPAEILTRAQIALWLPSHEPRVLDGAEHAVGMFSWLADLVPEPSLNPTVG